VGVRLFLKVKSLLVDAERLMDQIRAESLEPVGRVTLGLLPSIGPAVIGKLFNAIRKNNPGIKLKVLEGSGGQIEEWLADSRVDIAILYRYGAGFSTLEESLAIIDSYLVGPANDRITARPEIRFDELDKLPFILPSAPNGLRAVLDSTARHRRISLEPVIEADSLPLQKALVATEKLYTVLPLHAVWAEISQGTLRAAKIVDPPVRRTVAMVSVKSKGPSRAVSAVSSLIVQIVSAMAREGLWHSTSS
jgi:DNA-binding transcriptional LysR family regulator